MSCAQYAFSILDSQFRCAPGSFLQRVKAVSFQVRPALLQPVRPANIDAIDSRRRSESEVHAEIVLRQVTAAAAHLLPLLDGVRDDVDAGADGVAVGLHAG